MSNVEETDAQKARDERIRELAQELDQCNAHFKEVFEELMSLVGQSSLEDFEALQAEQSQKQQQAVEFIRASQLRPVRHYQRNTFVWEIRLFGEVLINCESARQASRFLARYIAISLFGELKSGHTKLEPTKAVQNTVSEPLRASIARASRTETSTQTRSEPRCAWHKVIKRTFAIAEEKRLDTNSDERMREAISRFLGREIKSRSELSRSEWLVVGDGIKYHGLAW